MCKIKFQVKLKYHVSQFMSDDSGYLLLICCCGEVRIVQQGHLSVRDQTPILNGPSSKIWYCNLVY